MIVFLDFPLQNINLGLKSMFKLLHEDFVFHMASEGTTNNNEIKILIAHKKRQYIPTRATWHDTLQKLAKGRFF